MILAGPVNIDFFDILLPQMLPWIILVALILLAVLAIAFSVIGTQKDMTPKGRKKR